MQKNKTRYIQAVLVVFCLLILSRIPSFIHGKVDGVLIVSTLIELVFFIWGMLILKK
jgi:hypothetical protein